MWVFELMEFHCAIDLLEEKNVSAIEFIDVLEMIKEITLFLFYFLLNVYISQF